MRFHHPRQPSYFCNASIILGQSTQGMGPAEKAAFVALLDLQEPVATLSRYAEAGIGGSRGHVESFTMLSLILRMGDSDMIKGVITSPSFVAPRVWHTNRDQSDANDGMAKTAAKIALARADLPTLRLAQSVLAATTDPIERHLSLNGTSEHDDAVRMFAWAADANKPESVEACADWLAQSLGARMMAMLASDSAKALREAKKQAARAVASAYVTMLDLACQAGSSNLARAAVAGGARFGLAHVEQALENGNPALARIAWAAVAGESDADKAKALITCATSLSSLGRSLRSGEDKWTVEGFAEIKKELGAFVMEAITPARDANSELGRAQREVLAQAMPWSNHFEKPSAWVRLARLSHPLPSPVEARLLMLSNKGAMLAARLGDAKSAGVDARWRAEALRELVAEDNGAGFGQKKEPRELLRTSWRVKLAMSIQPFFSGQEHPLMALSKMGHARADLERVLSEFDSEALSRVAPSAPAGSRGIRI